MLGLEKKKVCCILILSLMFASLGVCSNLGKIYASSNSYVVKYVEAGTENEIYTEKIVEGKEVGTIVREEAPHIGGFLYPEESVKDVVVGEDMEVIFYYQPNTLTTVDPGENENLQARGISAPITSWNIVDKGPYYPDTEGTYYSNVLYTNYKFCGKTSYAVRIHNSNDVPVKITIRTALETYSTLTLQPGSTWNVTVHTPKTSTKFYIKFKSESNYLNFYGSIK